MSFDAVRDIERLGLLASLWRYAEESRRLPPVSASPAADPVAATRAPLPHMVAVQSESFFDARVLFAGIRPQVLAEFDRLRAESARHGRLSVPAWGANTVRSEFAFLCGLTASSLGVHRFNPYRAVARGWDVGNVTRWLKRLGYKTIAIHPYPASFYQRNLVYPRLGFDQFLDISAFAGAERAGPYVSDLAVARKIDEVLARAVGPVFVFAITMENHGPLHLETVGEGDVSSLYSSPPPRGCDDLTIYLRHLRNADRMISALRETLTSCSRPAELCWFGDHVPIMPEVYRRLGAPAGEVDYLLWSSRRGVRAEYQDHAANELAREWLRVAGLLVGGGQDVRAG